MTNIMSTQLAPTVRKKSIFLISIQVVCNLRPFLRIKIKLQSGCYPANNTSIALVFIYNRVIHIIATSLHHFHIIAPLPHHCITTTSLHHYHITIMDSLLGQEFETIQKAHNIIIHIIIDTGLSYKKLKSTRICYILIYKDNTYITHPFLYQYSILTYTGGFRVHASYLRRLGITRITIYTPYTCSFTIYTHFRYSNAISYTLIYYLDIISQDWSIRQ